MTYGLGPSVRRAIARGNLKLARTLELGVTVKAGGLGGRAIDPVQAQLAQCRKLKVCKPWSQRRLHHRQARPMSP